MAGFVRSLRARADRGAVAVEGALIGAFILMPLLLGVFYYGNYFWKAQQVPTLADAPIPPNAVSGTFTCQELIDRVKSLLSGNVSSLASQLGIADGLIQTVVSVVPSASIGATVSVTYTIPLVDQVSSLLPLPNGGAVVEDFTQRLENVKVTSTSC